MGTYDLYFGSFGGCGGTYILGYVFDEEDGSLTYKSRLDGLFNPSYTNFDREFKLFFSVSKNKETGKGYIYSWRVKEDGFEPAGRFATGGKDPCYVMTDRTNRYISVSNYTSGSFKIWKFDGEGRLTPCGRAKNLRGSSVDPRRQTHSYAHSTVWSPWHDVVYVCDLGSDRVIWYRKDEDGEGFSQAGAAKVKPGSGPRHLAFAPDKKVAYLLNEMGGSLTVFSVLKGGALVEKQHISTLPDDFSGRNTSSDVHVSGDGRFVYASNRGHDSIAIFSADESGILTLVDFAPSLGKTPRGFDLSPSGKWLVSANQDSDNIIIFRRDEATGLLEPAREYKDIAGIVNVRFKLK